MFTKGEKIYIFITFLIGLGILLLFLNANVMQPANKQWEFQSIDTMKSSRDQARFGLNNTHYANDVDKQIAAIAKTGATHVAIATPYDAEFLPVLRLWVDSARNHGLRIWFRGNFSGWEGWFGYSRIDESTHTEKVKQFILANEDLFRDGDIFSSCPECENGRKPNLHDPTTLFSYRQFLINEYLTTKDAFSVIGRDVASNYFSMNADVARAVMDRETTQQLDGLVVIDHYVLKPDDLAYDVTMIAAQSGGKVVLGELGAPIPDIHGPMTDEQQKEWLEASLQALTKVDSLVGVNYWVNKGGSTAIWRDNGSPKPALHVLSDYYQKKK